MQLVVPTASTNFTLSAIISINFKGCNNYSSSLKPIPYPLFSPLSQAELPRALGKIFSMAKPKFLDAFVIFASMMQRYEFFSTYTNFVPVNSVKFI